MIYPSALGGPSSEKAERVNAEEVRTAGSRHGGSAEAACGSALPVLLSLPADGKHL